MRKLALSALLAFGLCLYLVGAPSAQQRGNYFEDCSATVGTTSTALLTAFDPFRNTLLIHNPHATAYIAINLTGGTAAINTAGSITISPLFSILLDVAVPRGPINVIASGSSTPVTCNIMH